MHYTLDNTIRAGKPVSVYLDGKEVRDVHEAHTEEGWLVRSKRDANGRLEVDLALDEIKRETLRGEVSVFRLCFLGRPE